MDEEAKKLVEGFGAALRQPGEGNPGDAESIRVRDREIIDKSMELLNALASVYSKATDLSCDVEFGTPTEHTATKVSVLQAYVSVNAAPPKVLTFLISADYLDLENFVQRSVRREPDLFYKAVADAFQRVVLNQ